MVSTSQKILAIAAHISYLLFGVGYILVPLIIFLVRKDEDDFTTEHAKQALCVQVIAALLGVIVGGLMFLSVGLVGEYIGKIYLEVKGRPRYYVEKILR